MRLRDAVRRAAELILFEARLLRRERLDWPPLQRLQTAGSFCVAEVLAALIAIDAERARARTRAIVGMGRTGASARSGRAGVAHTSKQARPLIHVPPLHGAVAPLSHGRSSLRPTAVEMRPNVRCEPYCGRAEVRL
jgi:hypothetical protein